MDYSNYSQFFTHTNLANTYSNQIGEPPNLDQMPIGLTLNYEDRDLLSPTFFSSHVPTFPKETNLINHQFTPLFSSTTPPGSDIYQSENRQTSLTSDILTAQQVEINRVYQEINSSQSKKRKAENPLEGIEPNVPSPPKRRKFTVRFSHRNLDLTTSKQASSPSLSPIYSHWQQTPINSMLSSSVSSPNDPLTPNSTVTNSRTSSPFVVNSSQSLHSMNDVVGRIIQIQQEWVRKGMLHLKEQDRSQIRERIDDCLKDNDLLSILDQLQLEHQFLTTFFRRGDRLIIPSQGEIEGVKDANAYIGAYLIQKLMRSYENNSAQFFKQIEIKPFLKELFAFWFVHSADFEAERHILHFLFNQKRNAVIDQDPQATFQHFLPPLTDLYINHRWSQNDYFSVLEFIGQGIAWIRSTGQPILFTSDRGRGLNQIHFNVNQSVNTSITSQQVNLENLIQQLTSSATPPFLIWSLPQKQPMDYEIGMLGPLTLNTQDLIAWIKVPATIRHPLLALAENQFLKGIKSIENGLSQTPNLNSNLTLLARLYVAVTILRDKEIYARNGQHLTLEKICEKLQMYQTTMPNQQIAREIGDITLEILQSF